MRQSLERCLYGRSDRNCRDDFKMVLKKLVIFGYDYGFNGGRCLVALSTRAIVAKHLISLRVAVILS